MSAITDDDVVGAVLTIFDEGYVDPAAQSQGTWFTDGGEGSGFLGTLRRLDAAAASRPLSPGDPLSAASHAEHLRFSLSLANRAYRGENPYSGVDWSSSWAVRAVDEAGWRELLERLETEIGALREALTAGAFLASGELFTGTLGLLCHGAWHLGALRQGLGLVTAPGRG